MLLTRGLTSDFDSVCALYARVTSAMHEKGCLLYTSDAADD